MNIQNILVPIDFSDCSKNALKYAIYLAKKFQAKIHMVNAVHVHSAHPDVVGGSIVAAVIKDYEDMVRESFEKLEKEIIELQDVPHSADQFLAYLIDAIHTECETKDIDFIVMGTKAEHDELEKVLGSRTTDVIDTATVPILVVPEGWEKAGIEIIAFACQMEEVKNPMRVKMLNQFALDFGAKIEAFTVAKRREDITAADQNIFKNLIHSFDEGIASFSTIEASSTIEGITSFCNSHHPDLLTLIPKEHTFFERLFKKSISKSIALHVPVPALFFRE